MPEPQSQTPALEPFQQNFQPREKKDFFLKNMDKFIDKMADVLNRREEKLTGPAKDPIDRLFDHHRGKAKARGRGENHPAFSMIEQAQKQMDQLIDKLTRHVFENQLSVFS
jgi:hypothetical protein